MSKSIALFGGSFNPPHAGHREMIRRLARRKRVDEVWVIPVYKHPFGKKLAPFSERLRQCRILFQDLGEKVKIKDIERRLGGMSWTVRLIRHLRKKNPSYQFFWVMGADTWKQRHLWKDFEELASQVRFVVFPRGKRSPIPDVSSTEIRRQQKK